MLMSMPPSTWSETPVEHGDFGDARETTRRRPTGVHDEDVDRVEPAERGLHERLASFLRRDVGGDGKQLLAPSLALDLPRRPADRGFLAAAHRDPRAFARELLGDRST